MNEALNKILSPNFERKSAYVECDNGWSDLILELHEKLLAIDPNYIILQIKEKFGYLRYYYSTELEDYSEMENLVSEYTKKSGEICEKCGSTNTIDANLGGWYKRWCETCVEEFQKENPKLNCATNNVVPVTPIILNL